jgi:hypothetical protein
VPHLRRSGANLLISQQLGDGGQRRRISGERRRYLGGRVRLQVLRFSRRQSRWQLGQVEEPRRTTRPQLPSTRAPDVADNLPRNWLDGSCRIIPETITTVATSDVVLQVEVGIQGTRTRGIPTAWERTWAGMTRRAEFVAVDWLWSGLHLDLETGSLVQGPTLQRGPAGRLITCRLAWLTRNCENQYKCNNMSCYWYQYHSYNILTVPLKC